MRKIIFTIVLWLLMSPVIFAQKEEQRNNIIVFDITGSMVGLPQGSGNTDIWNSSLDLLEKQLSSFTENKKEGVSIYLFGKDLISLGTYESNFNQNNVNAILEEIAIYKTQKKMQSYTCIYKSLKKIIKELPQNTTNTIYLFTDGKNSDHYKGCGNVDSQDLLTTWTSISKANDFLYIFKLKDFQLSADLEKNPKIEIVEDALHNYIVDIEPLNKNIKISRKSQLSNQKFRVTGAGKTLLSKDILIKTSNFTLTNKNNTENADVTRAFKLNSQTQQFQIAFFNQIQNIKTGVYGGELFYEFDNGKKEKKVSQDNYTITLHIKNDKCKVAFDNEKDKPKVEIEFVN